MNNFHLSSTNKTPKISFDLDTSIFEISGRSIPENSLEFYRPVLEWVELYFKSPNTKTILQINLEYFNTSSSKCLVELIRIFEKYYLAGMDITIKWFYEQEDEDSKESGEDFKTIFKLPVLLEEIFEEE